MMNEKEYKTAVQTAFDEASEGYDLPALRFFDKSARRLIDDLALKGHENVLDIATGTGKVALEASARLKSGKVTGIDMSEGMLAQARQKALTLGLKNVSFHHLDVDKAVFPEKYFDGITCGFGVHFWSNMEKPLLRMIRFLKPDAFVAVTSFSEGSFEPQTQMTLKRFESYGVKLPDSYTWKRLGSSEKCISLFENIGLKNIRSYKAPMGYPLKSPDEWWDLLRYSGFRAYLNKLSPEQAKHYKAENLKEVWGTGEENAVPLKVDVIFTVAYT